MKNAESYSIADKVLFSAYLLSKDGVPIAHNPLIIKCWHIYQSTFSLEGYPDFPDSHKIASALCGEKGLVGRGLLMRVGKKEYEITREGKTLIKKLMGEKEEPKPKQPTQCLPVDLDTFAIASFANPAFTKINEGRNNEVTFADACKFWGLPETANGGMVSGVLDIFYETLGDLEGKVDECHRILSNGRHIEGKDVVTIANISELLHKRFARHLELLRNRK